MHKRNANAAYLAVDKLFCPLRARLQSAYAVKQGIRRRTSMLGIHRVGAVCLTSFDADHIHIPYVAAPMPNATIAVFALQDEGRDHQPPAGDQTSFGSALKPGSASLEIKVGLPESVANMGNERLRCVRVTRTSV